MSSFPRILLKFQESPLPIICKRCKSRVVFCVSCSHGIFVKTANGNLQKIARRFSHTSKICIFDFACLKSCKLSMKLCHSQLISVGRRQNVFHLKDTKSFFWRSKKRRKFPRNSKLENYGDVELWMFVNGIDKWPACPKRERSYMLSRLTSLKAIIVGWRLLTTK